MELLFLNENFEIKKLVDTFQNFSWQHKYFEPGCFSIETFLEDYAEIRENNCKYLCSKDYRETALIETVKYKGSYNNTNVVLTGRFLEQVLEDRVIKNTFTYTGTREEIARKLVNDFCINCENPLFNGNLRLGTYKGLGSRIVYQNTGDDIKTALYSLLKVEDMSYSIDYDYTQNTLTFNVWKGLDRTESQSVNSWAIFSRNFENIEKDEYSKDETQFKNVAYVAGEGIGGDRIVVEVNQVANDEDRKELYVDARDLQQKDDMSDSEYRQTLYQRGLEKLEENNRVEITEFEVDINANITYKEDFDLGDKVMYKNEDLGIYVENRIVEISEVFEGNEETIEVVFGDDYSIKKVVK